MAITVNDYYYLENTVHKLNRKKYFVALCVFENV